MNGLLSEYFRPGGAEDDVFSLQGEDPLLDVNPSQINAQQAIQNATDGSGQSFIDIVYGSGVKLSGTACKFLHTPQLQRLRQLRQLGCSHYVFHNANHTRHEHSIGVASTARQLAWRLHHLGLGLKEPWATEIGHRQRSSDIKCVEIAGLCHDLGHGPFSHMFENEFLPRVGYDSKGWTHEEMGISMLDALVDGAGGTEVLDVDECELRFIKSLILAGSKDAPKAPTDRPMFLYDIIANKRNGIDVDKWDYLARDALYCGQERARFEITKLLEITKVIGGGICYRWDKWETLLDVFQARASMHRHVYTHKEVKAAEYMVTDAMVEANSELEIAPRIADPERFLTLDDTIIAAIRSSQSDGPGLRRAKELLRRLDCNDRYVMAHERVGIPLKNFEKPTPEDISTLADSGQGLRPEHIIIHDRKIDMGMREKFPLEHVGFYLDEKDSLHEGFRITQDDLHEMVPKKCMDRTIRVFVKERRFQEDVKAAFDRWVSQRLSSAEGNKRPRLHD